MSFSPIDILWVFLILSSLQPIFRQKMLEEARRRLMRRIQRMRGSRVISLIHRQETMAILGFPIVRYIDVNDSEEVIRAIHTTDPETPIDIILHTPGGLVLAATQIANAVRRHRAKVTVFVPHYAMSGGTLIALAADEIVMDEHAVLGPVDPQLGEYPAPSILAAVSQKDRNEIDDRTLILADVAQKAIGQVRETIRELLAENLGAEKAAELADVLTRGTWTHDFPITYETAKALGLPVRCCEIPEEIYALMDLFPQPVRRRPGVEYLTEPPGGRPPKGS